MMDGRNRIYSECGRREDLELIHAVSDGLLLCGYVSSSHSTVVLLLLLLFYPFFGFQRGYGMTERLDFILNEINGYYNSNDRWKFILFLIR